MTISFRIRASAAKALQDEAKKQNVSLNTLVNQIFVAYTDFDRLIKRFDMLKISSPTFKLILECSTDEEMLEAGRVAGNGVPESFMLAKAGEVSLSGALDYLRLMGTYAGVFDYSEVVHEGKISITLTHSLGQKGSVFLSGYVESIFKNLGKEIKVSRFQDSISLEI